MSPKTNAQTLEKYLAQFTREGILYERLNDKKVRCFACGHRCLIPNGRFGVCRVRYNEEGLLKVPYGYTAGMNCDPIEKKPFFHFLPGSNAMSFGMMGCDFHCSYCQNWISSQAIRDEKAGVPIRPIQPDEFVTLAERYGARSVTSTYNEPLITSEWAVEIFRLAKKRKLLTSFVSNGNGTPEAIEYLQPWIDGYKIDLKSFQDKEYRKLGGRLDIVLNTIQLVKDKNIWMEIVTLVVPGLNDSEEELRDIARFIASVDPAVPWHVTAFHEDYKMRGMGSTPLRTLLRAGEIGKEEGLQFVYIGNLPGSAPDWENTYCLHCGGLLVERCGFRIGVNRIQQGVCPDCGERIPGVWN
ncbi:MAG: AmmeMemoRadiSam system radical SAM enzyme [Candidatus Hinthialibacter sp.]